MDSLLLINSLTSISTVLNSDRNNKDEFMSNLNYASSSIATYLYCEFERRHPHKQRTHLSCLEIVNNNASDIKYLNLSELDDEVCFTAIKNKPRSIGHIPREIRTSDMWKVAIDKDPSVIEFLSDNEAIQEIYDISTMKDPSLIRHVPSSFITYKMSWDASLVYPHSIKSIPNNILTEEMCGNIVRKNGYFLGQVPSNFITVIMCKDAVLNCPHAIKFIPKELVTEELYLTAVKLDGSVLRLIEKDQRTDTMRMAALNNYIFAFEFMHEDEMTEEICQMVVSKLGLSKLPRCKISSTVAFSGLKRNVKDIRYIPLNVLTPDMCAYVLNNGGSLDLIPPAFITADICRTAVLSNVSNTKHIPSQMRTSDMRVLISSCGGFEYLTKDEKCKESCIAAIKHNPFSCQYMTKEMLLYHHEGISLAEKAVSTNGFTLGCIIDKITSQNDLGSSQLMKQSFIYQNFDINKLCFIAVKNQPLAIKYASKYVTNELIELALSNNACAYRLLPDEFKTVKNMEIALTAPKCNNGRRDIPVSSLSLK